MEEKVKRLLYGIGAATIVVGTAFVAYKQDENSKKQTKRSKNRANNAYYDSLTEADIAWG